MVLDHSYINPEYRLRRSVPDISHTYDGFMIASDRLKVFIEIAAYKGVTFRDLPKAQRYYSMTVEQIVPVTPPTN
jgi:hypothetical protein